MLKLSEAELKRREQNRKANARRAQRLEIDYEDSVDLGRWIFAEYKAESTAKPDETVEETLARAKVIWLKEKQKDKKEKERLEKAIKDLGLRVRSMME